MDVLFIASLLKRKKIEDPEDLLDPVVLTAEEEAVATEEEADTVVEVLTEEMTEEMTEKEEMTEEMTEKEVEMIDTAEIVSVDRHTLQEEEDTTRVAVAVVANTLTTVKCSQTLNCHIVLNLRVW